MVRGDYVYGIFMDVAMGIRVRGNVWRHMGSCTGLWEFGSLA